MPTGIASFKHPLNWSLKTIGWKILTSKQFYSSFVDQVVGSSFCVSKFFRHRNDRNTSLAFRELEIGGILCFAQMDYRKTHFFHLELFLQLWGASPTSQSPSNSPALGVGVPWQISVTWVYVISRFSSNPRQNVRVFRWKFQCKPRKLQGTWSVFSVMCLLAYRLYTGFSRLPAHVIRVGGRLLLTVWKFDLEPFFFIYNYSY